MGYILLSKDYIENVKTIFQGYHIFYSAVIPNERNNDNNKICNMVYKINDIIPLCNNQNIYSIENEFKDFESLRKDFSYNLMYSNETFNFIANSKINSFYYTDSENTFYYSDKKTIIRTIASIMGEIVCENCLTKLYGNNIENYIVI